MVGLIIFLVFTQDTLYLSESKAYEMALSESPMVKAQKYSVLSSYYNKKSMISSFLPQISLSGTYTRLSLTQTMRSFMLDSLVMTPSGAFVPVGHYVEIPFSQKDNYDLGLQVQQVLFTFGKLIFSYKSADWNLKSEQLKDSITRGYMGITIRELYTQALLAKAYYDLMMKIDSELHEVYLLTKKKYDSGTATEIDYLQAKLAYMKQKNNILQAENAYMQTISLLKVMLNIPTSKEIVLTDSITPLELDIDTLKPLMLDIKQFDYTLTSLKYQKKTLDRLTFPTIFSAFSYKYQKPFGMENDWKDYWAVTLGFTWNIFDGFKSTSQAKSINAKIKSLEVLKDMKIKQRDVDILMKKKEVLSAEEALKVSMENAKLAETLYNSSKTQYEEGYMTYTDFSNVIINYHTSLIEKLKAIADLKIKQLELIKYMKGYILESASGQNTGFNMQSEQANEGKKEFQGRNSMKKGGF